MGKRGPAPKGKLSSIPSKKDSSVPRAPSWLGRWGREAWKTVCESHSFDPDARQLLEMYCHAYQEFHESREQWEQEGRKRTVPAGNGGERLNPLLDDMKTNKKQMKDLGTKLGLFDGASKADAPAAVPSKRVLYGK